MVCQNYHMWAELSEDDWFILYSIFSVSEYYPFMLIYIYKYIYMLVLLSQMERKSSLIF